MISKELQTFIREQNKHIQSLYPNLKDAEKYVYAQTVKLSEEMGELSEAVLVHYQTQRKSKQGKEISLEKEFGDVLITAMLVAQSMGVDVDVVLTERIEGLKQRRMTD